MIEYKICNQFSATCNLLFFSCVLSTKVPDAMGDWAEVHAFFVNPKIVWRRCHMGSVDPKKAVIFNPTKSVRVRHSCYLPNSFSHDKPMDDVCEKNDRR